MTDGAIRKAFKEGVIGFLTGTDCPYRPYEEAHAWGQGFRFAGRMAAYQEAVEEHRAEMCPEPPDHEIEDTPG